jgi:hypothetical protein
MRRRVGRRHAPFRHAGRDGLLPLRGPTDATGAEPLDEDTLGAALARAVIDASEHHESLEYEGDTYAGELSGDAEAFYDADQLMRGSPPPRRTAWCCQCSPSSSSVRRCPHQAVLNAPAGP